MKIQLLIIFVLFTSSCLSLHENYVIQESLIQKQKVEIILSTDDFNILRVAPQPKKGFYWPYLLLVGNKKFGEEIKTIWLETVNTGLLTNSYIFHEERGLSSLKTLFYNLKKFEDKFIFMMPVFLRPKDNWKLYTHALDRDSMIVEDLKYKRLDLQVLSMVEDAKVVLKDIGVKTREKFAIGGFSACGEFAQRFSVLHPNSLIFVVAGGIGGLPVLPIKEKDGKSLKYPIGISDLEKLSGKPFDQESFFNLPRLLYYGSEDTNDPVKYDDAYDIKEREVVFEVLGKDPFQRWLKCIELYKNFPTASELYIDEGMGHRTSKEMVQKIFGFITRQLK